MSQEINLFRSTNQSRKFNFGGAHLLMGLVMLFTGLLIYSGVLLGIQHSLKTQVAQLDVDKNISANRHKEITHQLAQHVNSDINEEIEKIEHLLANRKEILNKLREDMFDSGEGYSGYFIAFARQHISGLWLTDITIAHAGRTLQIKGQTITANLVPKYLEKLSDEALLTGTNLSDFQLDRPIENEKRNTRSEYIDFIVSTESDDAGTL